MVTNLLATARRQVKDGFSSLEGSSKYLYVILILNVLDSFSYFVLSLMYTVLLSEKFNVGDAEAGLSYGIWGLMMTFFSIVLSPLIDFLGVKKCLLIGFSLSTVGKTWVAFAHSKLYLWINVYGILPAGSAFTGTVLLIGVKRYCSLSGQGFAYGVYYALVNLAMFFSGFLFDFFRLPMKNSFKSEKLGPDSPLNDGLRFYLLVGAVISCLAFFLTMILKDCAVVEDDSVQVSLLDSEEHKQKSLRVTLKRYQEKARASFVKIKELRSITMVKYLIVCAVTINLKQIFRQLEATFPKYQTRAFGCDSPIGLIYSINPFIMIFLTPIVQAVTNMCSHYDVIHYGSYITAFAPLLLAVFQTEWASVLFVVFLSVGESIWYPRWYEYSMSMAPSGREAIFTALASAPQILAKFPAGWLSGFVLSEWCPNNGECSSDFSPMNEMHACQGNYVWGLMGMLSLTSPIGLSIGARWLKISRMAKVRNDINMIVQG